MKSKWPSMGFEPEFFIFEEKNMILMKKSNGKSKI
jgi:hypothetical protein